MYPKKLEVRRLIIQTTGTYGRQHRRPFTTNSTGQVVSQIMESVDRNKSLTPQNFMMSSPRDNFIIQQATPESEIQIANGFQTERLRFILQLVETDNMGNEKSVHVAGYTDYADLSIQSHLVDPQTRFFMNGVIQTADVTRRTAMGNQRYTNVMDASNIMINRNYQGGFAGGHVYSMTPENVFGNWQNLDLVSGAENPDDMLADTRIHLSGQPIKVKKRNAIAPQFATDILNTYLLTELGSEGMPQHDILTECMHMQRASSVMEDSFISYLMNRRHQEYGYTSTFDGSFSLDDLEALDPMVRQKMTIIPFVDNLHQMGMSADWGGSDMTTLIASTLAQSVPSYMAAVGLGVMELSSTNYSIDGQLVTNITGYKGFNAAYDLTAELTALVFKLDNELLRNISQNGMIGFELHMRVDSMGETWIELSLNGEPMVLYVAPTFCDALAAPVITLNRAQLDGLTQDMSTLMSNIHEQGLIAAPANRPMLSIPGVGGQMAGSPTHNPNDWSMSGGQYRI